MRTIWEVVYPDPRRRSAGEGDEATSSVFCDSPGDAASFIRHNGGVAHEKQITVAQFRRLQEAHLLR